MVKHPNSNESLEPRASRFLETSLSIKPFRDASNIKVKLTLWSELHVSDVAVRSNGLQLIGDVKFSSKNKADIQLKLVGEKGDIQFTLTLSDASTMGLSLFAIKGEKYVYVAEDSYDRAIDLQKKNELSLADYLRYKHSAFFALQPKQNPKTATWGLNKKQIYHLHGRIKWEDCKGNIHDLMGCLYSIPGVDVKICDKNGNIIKEKLYTSQNGGYDLYFSCTPNTSITLFVLADIKDAVVTDIKDGYGYGVCLLASYAKDLRDVDYNFIIRDEFKNEKHITSIPDGYTYVRCREGSPFTAALQITQALYLGFKYVAEMTDGKQLKKTQVLFPWNIEANDGIISYTIEYNIYLADIDYKVWDVILHEFGHVIQHQYDISDNPGGNHSSKYDHLISHGKDEGIRLAWGESWPTVFGIRITQYFRDRFNLQEYPYIADDRYDANDGNNEEWWGYSLEDTQNYMNGEGCERSIMGALYDMIDKSGKKANGALPLTDREFWDLLMKSKAKTFSQFIAHAYKKYGITNSKLANILTSRGLAPRNIKFDSDVISYIVPGSAVSGISLHTESHVELFDSLQSSKPLSSIKIIIKRTNEVNYRLPMSLLYDANIRYFYVRIYSYQKFNPRTGPYYSEIRRFEIPRLFNGMYTFFPSDFKFLSDRKQHSHTTTIENQKFTFEGFNLLYQNSKVLVNDPDNVGYSKLIIQTTNPMIKNVAFFLKVSRSNQNIFINPANKIEFSYLDDTRKEHIVWSKSLPSISQKTTQNKFFSINIGNRPAKEVVIKFSKFTPLGTNDPNDLNFEFGNIMINYDPNSFIKNFLKT